MPLTPPLIELGFYFDKSNDIENVKAIFRWLAYREFIARLHKVQVFKRPASACFASKYDLQEAVHLPCNLDFKFLSETDLIISKIDFDINVATSIPITEMSLRINDSIHPTDHHSISLFFNAGPVAIQDVDKDAVANRRTFGCLCSRLLCDISNDLLPLYSAVTVEYSLESAIDLCSNPQSLAFADFFIRSDINKFTFSEIKRLTTHYYRQLLPNGIYCSSTLDFNPDSISIDYASSSTLSCEIAAIISQSV